MREGSKAGKYWEGKMREVKFVHICRGPSKQAERRAPGTT